MTLLEDRLRSGLAALADEAATNVRADDLIGTIARVDRARRTRRVMAGVAAVAAAGLIGWTGLAPRPITVQPAPVASPSVTADSTVQYFGFDVGGPVSRHLVTVELNRSGDWWHLRVIDDPGTGERGRSRDFEVPMGTYFATTVIDNLSIAVVPDVVHNVQAVNERTTILQHREIRDVGLSLAITWSLSEPVLPPDLVWLGSDDVVRLNGTEVIPSVPLRLDDISVRVFRDARTGVWGYFTGDWWNTPPITTDPWGAEVRVLGPSDALLSLGMLPAGAADVTVTPQEPATWTVATLSDGTVWYLVRAVRTSSSDSSSDRYVRSISYTDVDGKRITYVPKLN